MEFFEITESNIGNLYELNQQLSVEEGQGDLFTANRDDYFSAFLGEYPFSFGFLCNIGTQVIGFYIYFYKFASYLGSRVFYIEDIYLTNQFRTKDNKHSLIQHALEQSKNENCCRVELRVLKTYNFGYDVIDDNGFNKISKWDVFRHECV